MCRVLEIAGDERLDNHPSDWARNNSTTFHVSLVRAIVL